MAKLYFEIEADYKKVIKLREEIEKLQSTMKSFDAHTSTDKIKKLESELRSLRAEYNKLADSAAVSGARIEKSSISFGKAIAAIGGVTALKQLGSEIIRVRGEFQEMETAIETLVGKEMSDKLLPQIKELAKVSPLTMTDIVGAEKMMLGFNIEADKTIGYLKALSDVSMGSSQKFNSLTLAFSQMSAAGKLMGQDLNQMINAGFNPLQQISKTTGKSIATLKEEMSKGAISAEMVQKAFIDATSAGGKFYKMSENASKTINGQISMMEDAWDSALNEMGEKSEGFIIKGIQATTTIIQNYETIGRVLVSLVATYGTYKAAVIANIALTRSWAVAARADATAKAIQTVATKAQTVATLALNKAMKMNPYVFLATSVVGLGTAMWSLSDKTTTAERAVINFNKEQERLNQQEANRKKTLEDLISVIQDESSAEAHRESALLALKELYPELSQQFVDEKGHIQDLIGLWAAYEGQVKLSRKESLESDISDLNTRLTKTQDDIKDAKGGTNIAALRILEQREKNIKAELKVKQDALNELNNQAAGMDEKADSNYKQSYEQAKKEWEAAKKRLNDIEKDKSKYTTQEYTEAKNNESTKRKEYEKLGGKTDKQLKQEEKAADKEKQLKQQLSNELLAIQRQNEQAQVDLMKEGSSKRIAQIELDYQKELDAISKQKQEWMSKQGGKLTDEQYGVLGMKQINAETKKDSELAKVLEDEKTAMWEYLKEFGNFVEKKEATINLFNQKIANASTEGEKKSLSKRMERELAAIDDAAQGTTSHIAMLFEDMSERTIAQMREIADEAETILAYLKTGQWVEVKNEKGEGTGKDAYGFTKEQFNTLKDDPEKIKAIGDGIKNVRENADKAESPLKKMSDAFHEMFRNPEKAQEYFQSVVEGVRKITDAVNFLGDSLGQISDAFGGNFLGGIAEGIGVATDAVNSAMSGAQAGVAFVPWGAAAGAAIGLVSSLTSSLSKLHDKKHEKTIQEIQNQIEVLEKSYEKLGKEIEDAYSHDAQGLIEDQNKLLAQQKILIKQQIAEEEKKKKIDTNRIKGWEEQIEEIDKTIEDNKEKAIDAIFGSDLQSAIDDFANAYADAWSAGEDRAKSAKDFVKSMIKNMIMEAIKAQASEPMQRLRSLMAGFFYDGMISMWEEEQLNKAAENLQKELAEKFGWADRFMSDSYSQEASSKGFQTMSQDTGEELNGRFTALQISGEEIRKNTSVLTITTSEIKSINASIRDSVSGIQDQLANSYLELVAINENTGASAKYLKEIKADIAQVKDNTKNL